MFFESNCVVHLFFLWNQCNFDCMVEPFQTRPATVDRYKLPMRCSFCGEYATTEALFEVSGCVLVQIYCDRCLQAANYEIPS